MRHRQERALASLRGKVRTAAAAAAADERVRDLERRLRELDARS